MTGRVPTTVSTLERLFEGEKVSGKRFVEAREVTAIREVNHWGRTSAEESKKVV
jgi:hypothetical protein